MKNFKMLSYGDQSLFKMFYKTKKIKTRINLRKYSRSYSEEEVAKFSTLSSKWWNRNGEFQALHSMNKLRVPFIRDNLLLQGHGVPLSPKPLKGISILDVGCGAGILSENLARIGASVVGIDPSSEAITAANLHKEGDNELKELQYIDSPLEDIVALETLEYDCIVASEVIEHSLNPHQFLEMCIKLLKPSGSIFISTINRTLLSYLLAIQAAENIFSIVPSKTHDWNKFVTTKELTHILQNCNCYLRKVLGMQYNPITDNWTWTENKEINYIVHAMKTGNEKFG